MTLTVNQLVGYLECCCTRDRRKKLRLNFLHVKIPVLVRHRELSSYLDQSLSKKRNTLVQKNLFSEKAVLSGLRNCHSFPVLSYSLYSSNRIIFVSAFNFIIIIIFIEC